MAGPLGDLPGMTFDPLRNRYFPIPKSPPPPPHPSSSAPAPWNFSLGGGSSERRILGMPSAWKDLSTGGCLTRDAWRPPVPLVHPDGGGESSRSAQRVRGMKRRRIRLGEEEGRIRRERAMGQQVADLGLSQIHKSGQCSGENVTALKSFVNGSYFAATDHGKAIVHRQEGKTMFLSICEAPFMGMHSDLARLTTLFLSSGPSPHIHTFFRDPTSHDVSILQHSQLDIPPRTDLFSSASFDERLCLGTTKSLCVVAYEGAHVALQKRKMESDVLSVDMRERDIAWCGTRGGRVGMIDLRTPGGLAGGERGSGMDMREGKAVVRVKRLQDGAVPWGLVASGMSNEMLVFDVRYGASPLWRMQGHQNDYRSDLGLTTVADDTILLAASTDNRVRVWSTLTGDRVLPSARAPRDTSLLRMVFPDRVRALEPRLDDGGVDVGCKGDVYRFGEVRRPLF